MPNRDLAQNIIDLVLDAGLSCNEYGYELDDRYFDLNGRERFALEHTDPYAEGFLTNVHQRGQCAGEYCTIHNRSDHHLRHWRQHWRGDRGIMERIDPVTGIGHPDLDSPWPNDSYEWIHGCDGGCALPVYPNDVDKEDQ